MYFIYQSKKKKRKEDIDEKLDDKPPQTVRNILPRDGLSSIPTPGTTGLENCSLDTRRRMKTILGWYGSLVVLLFIKGNFEIGS
jgi:hypothetical protein